MKKKFVKLEAILLFVCGFISITEAAKKEEFEIQSFFLTDNYLRM